MGRDRQRGRADTKRGGRRAASGLWTFFALLLLTPLVMPPSFAAENPRGVLQEMLGAGMASTSRAETRQVAGVTIHENCRGTCSFLKLVQPNAIALGNHVFAETALHPPHLRHELTHVRQSQELGMLWIPAYIWEYARHMFHCGLDTNCYRTHNRFEAEALDAEHMPMEISGRPPPPTAAVPEYVALLPFPLH